MSRYVDFYLIGELVDSHGNVHYEDLKNLPTAYVVEHKRGEWIIQDGNVVCSECFEPNLETNYCPNCGADMRGDINEQIH